MNEIIEEMSRVLKGKRVCLFWSGGYESTALLALLIGQKLYEGCDLHVVTVAFPQEIYEGKAVDEIGRRLRACGVDHIVLVPRESMGHDYPFDRACARCKQIRRTVICDHLKEYYGDGEVVYLTGHNLDDIASYTLELLAAYLDVTAADVPPEIPYLRVLACNERGRKLLKTIKKTGSAPVLTKSADVRALSEEAQKLFALTARAADQYVLAYPELRAARGSSAWTEGPVIV